MRRGIPVLVLVLAAGCAGTEGDIRRAEMREFFLDFVKGKDRGPGAYTRRFKASIRQSKGGGRYQYVDPAHMSNFFVDQSLRGLGGTRIDDSDELGLVADWLLRALALDPTENIRSLACEQIGRVLLRIPEMEGEPAPHDPLADTRIVEYASDLKAMQQRREKGEKVLRADVVDRMRLLAATPPPTLQTARLQVFTLAVPPTVHEPAGSSVKVAAGEIVPPMVRRAFLVALREVATGDRIRPHFPADESPMVRAAAARVLARVASPIALDQVVWALRDPLDPRERDPDVRRALVGYLGAVGGARAFATCLVRLDDRDLGVRFHAQAALLRMTGASGIPPRREAWEAWRAARPAWQALPEEAPPIVPDPGPEGG